MTIILFACCLIVGGTFVSAAQVVKTGDYNYQHFNKIYALESAGGRLYVAESITEEPGRIVALNKDSAALLGEVTGLTNDASDFAAFGDTLAVLWKNNILTFYDGSTGLSETGSVTLSLSAIPSAIAYCGGILYLGAGSDIYPVHIRTQDPGGAPKIGAYYLDIGVPYRTTLDRVTDIIAFSSDGGHTLMFFGFVAGDREGRSLTTSNSREQNFIAFSPYFNALCYSPTSHKLIFATNAGIFAFDPDYNIISEKYDATTSIPVSSGRLGLPSAVTCADGEVFAADDEMQSVQALTLENLTFARNVFAGKSDASGRFNAPGGTYAADGKLFVADTRNNRVQIIGSEITAVDFQFTAPSGIAVSSNGSMYVVDQNGRRLTRFRADYSFDRSFSGITDITDIDVSLDNNLYIAMDSDSQTAIFALDAGQTNFRLLATLPFRPQKIAHSPNRRMLYILSDKVVYSISTSLNNPVAAIVHAFSQTVSDIAVDYDGTIFALTRNSLIRLQYGTEVIIGDAFDEPLRNGAAIHFAQDDGTYYSYGDLLVCDRGKSIIQRVPASVSGALTINPADGEHYIDYTSASGCEEIMRLPESTPAIAVYQYPFYLGSAANGRQNRINPGDYVIVLRKNLTATDKLPDNEFFCQILYGETVNGKLEVYSAYVLRYLLESVDEIAPPWHLAGEMRGRIYQINAPFYKYPLSSGEAKIDELAQGQPVTVLDFLPNYKDASNKTFYRVRLSDDRVGFIETVNIFSRSYAQSASANPVGNAYVIADSGSMLYELIDGKYVETGHRLQKGEKIHIVGRFDSSSEYSEIRYYSSGEIMRLYVRSETVKSDLFSYTQVIAVVLILLVVIILTTMFFTRRRIFAKASEPRN